MASHGFPPSTVDKVAMTASQVGAGVRRADACRVERLQVAAPQIGGTAPCGHQ